MLAFGSPKIGTDLGFVFCTQKLGKVCFLWKFWCFFADLRKKRGNLKLDGEVCSRNKDKLSCLV